MSFDAKIATEFIPYIALGFSLFSLLLLIRLEYRFKRLLRGKKAKDLEDSILQIQKDLAHLILAQKDAHASLQNIDTRMKKSIQGIGVVRFNPFKGTSGSNQSFSLALLNERGDGAVLSSIYSREHVSTFAKPIKDTSSEYELTPEEKEAIASAEKSVKS